MTIARELQSIVKRVRISGWIALMATLVLLVELNLIVTTAWVDFDFQTQMIIFGITLIIVLTFGFTRIGPKGIAKKGRRRR